MIRGDGHPNCVDGNRCKASSAHIVSEMLRQTSSDTSHSGNRRSTARELMDSISRRRTIIFVDHYESLRDWEMLWLLIFSVFKAIHPQTTYNRNY